MKKEMTWNEVGQYYGRSYKKIIEALKINSETFSFKVDTFLVNTLNWNVPNKTIKVGGSK